MSRQARETNPEGAGITKAPVERAFRDPLLQKYIAVATQVMELESEVAKLSQDEMQDLTRYWKQEVSESFWGTRALDR